MARAPQPTYCMTTRHFFTCLALLFTSTLFAANPIRLTGKILAESTSEPVVFASVAFHSLPDSTFVKGTATDINGDFSLEVEGDQGFLKVSFISYQTQVVTLDLSKGSQTLKNVLLSASVTSLNEITVQDEKSQMELQLDKKVFNVGKDLGTTGGNAQDVLENVPSVTVDEEGNVGLRGSNNVRILINGKPSGLVGVDPAAAMEQIPASLIERVEVITNPSARYDAEGEVGIINIVLKKEQRKGFNGSLEVKTGIPDHHGLTAVLNYRSKKVNYFASYSTSLRNSPGFGNSRQEFFNSDSLQLYERTRDRTRGGFNQNINLGADFELNAKNTLSISGLYKNGQGRNSAHMEYMDYGTDNELLLATVRDETEQEPENNVQFTIGHVKQYDKNGKEWSTEFRFIQNDETELSDIEETYSDKRAPLYQRSSNTEDEINYFFQTDFVLPLPALNGKMEIGAKSTNRIINNEFLVEQRLDDSEWSILSDFNNHFIYTERIQAAYAMFSGNLNPQLKYQLGLRSEYSDIKTEMVLTGEKNQRTYNNLFPSAHFTYDLQKGRSIQLSYSRRLSRPSFRYLLPFSSFSDNRNFYVGNPNLDPEYTDAFELGYVKYWDMASLLSSVYYRNRKGVIERVSYADNDGILFRMPINLGEQNAVGIEFSGNYEVRKWWRFNGSLNAYNAVTTGNFEGTELRAEILTIKGRIASNMKFKKRFNLQYSFDYNAPRQNTQGKVQARYAINMGLSANLLNDKATLTFSGRDLLNSRVYRWTTETDDFTASNDFMWRVRSLTLSFQYRINNYKGQRRSKQRGYDVNDNINLD